MARNGLLCADVPLRNCSLTHSLTADLSRVIIQHGLSLHQYADDCQVYLFIVCQGVTTRQPWSTDSLVVLKTWMPC